MTLRFVLRHNKKYKNVKVGSSSSFFYAGNREYALQKIDSLDAYNQRNIARQYKQAESFIGTKKFQELSTERQVLLAQRRNTLKKWNDHYVDLLDRQVKETYESGDEDNCLIIIVEGIEIGAYWYIGEKIKGSPLKGISA